MKTKELKNNAVELNEAELIKAAGGNDPQYKYNFKRCDIIYRLDLQTMYYLVEEDIHTNDCKALVRCTAHTKGEGPRHILEDESKYIEAEDLQFLYNAYGGVLH